MKIRKICILAVLAIFLLSLVPAALAEKSDLPAGIEAVKQRVEAGLKDKGKHLAVEKFDEAKPVLAKAREKIHSAVLNYEQAKEKYQEAKDKYLDSKQKVVQIKNKIQGCEDSENCTLERKQFRVQTKDHLIDLADVVLRTLDKLEQKIIDSDLEDKDELLASIQEQIADVEDAKETLLNLTDDLTNEELQAAIQTIKDAWLETQPKIKLGAGKLIQAKLGNIVVSIERLEAKFEKIKENLDSKGYDTSELDGYMDDLDDKMASAEEAWENAKAKFQEAKEATTVKEMQDSIREAHQYQTQARELIKEAREDIRRIVKAIRDAQSVEEPEETEDQNSTETGDQNSTVSEDENETIDMTGDENATESGNSTEE